MMKKLFTLGSVIGLLGGSALIIVIAVAAVRQTNHTNSIEQEIARLQAEADRIKQSNTLLNDRIAYFSSHEFQEREAKEKLGLQKEGEKIVMIRPSVSQEASEEQSLLDSQPASTENIHNYKKWWRIFFHAQS